MDSLCNLKVVLTALRHFFERGASGVPSRATTGDSRMEDKDVGIRFGHQNLGVLFIERIPHSQQIQLPSMTKHVNFFLIPKSCPFQGPAELSVEPRDRRKVVHSGEPYSPAV